MLNDKHKWQAETDWQTDRQREKGDIHIKCTGENIIKEYMHTFITVLQT